MTLIDITQDVDDWHERRQRIARLEGEAKVLRILLGTCLDVIETIEGEDSTETDRLARLKSACVEALKVVT